MPEDVSTEVVEQETTAAESSTEENNSPETEQKDEFDQVFEDNLSEDQTEGDSEFEESAEETNESEEPIEYKGAEARKQELNTQIRDLVAQKNSLAQEVSQLQELQEVFAQQAPTVDELVDQGYSESDARLMAVEEQLRINNEQMQAREVQSSIADLQHNLQLDRFNLMKDYPVFDPQSDQYDEGFAKRASQMYEQAAQVRYDNEGRPISASQKLYSFMAELADMRGEGVKAGRVRGQRSAEQQMSRATPPSSASVNKEFSHMSLQEQESYLRRRGHDIPN